MESELIAHVRKRLPPHPLLRLGIGDDAAVLRTAEMEDCVLTVDLLTDHVDFELTGADPRRVGRKALAVNLSDLAAMGCGPRWALTGLGLRRGLGEAWVREFVHGLLACAREFGLSLVGGDFCVGNGPTSVTLTALGAPFPGGPIRRRGARPGHVLAVTGALGGSLRGRHLRFTPRLAESGHRSTERRSRSPRRAW